MIARVAVLPMLLLPAVRDDAEDRAEELRRHQGTWAVERSVRDGEDGPEEALREIVRTVDGARIVWKRAGEPFAATTFELDPSTEPKAIDLIPEGGRNRGDRVLGIYRFRDDRLELCIADAGRPRPSEFAAGPGSGSTLMTFRRVEAEAPPPADSP